MVFELIRESVRQIQSSTAHAQLAKHKVCSVSDLVNMIQLAFMWLHD